MARARNIKPGFFKNELLVEMGAFDRLLFIGLWCMADREGRIEDRPKRIKLELFPCDTYDVDAGLRLLENSGFVKRYTNNVKSVISIVNFHKHQTPHGSEKDSELPDVDGNLTINARDKNGYVTGKKRINSQKTENNVKSEENNGGLQDEHVGLPAKTTLNPDILNPDILNPDSKKTTRKRVPKISKPDDVEQQTWDDWVALRKAKKATVSNTVIDEARRECAKVGITLERFLTIWCMRGSQGLQADWLKPAEIANGPPAETTYQRSKRELYERAIGQRTPIKTGEIYELTSSMDRQDFFEADAKFRS